MRLVSEATACGLIAFSTEQGNRSPESTAAVTCYRHTTALLKLGPGHSPGVRRAEPPSGSGRDRFQLLGMPSRAVSPSTASADESCPLPQAAASNDESEGSSQLQSSLPGGKRCPLGLPGSESPPAAQPHLLPFSSRAVDSQGAPNRLPAPQSSSPNLLPRDTVHLE